MNHCSVLFSKFGVYVILQWILSRETRRGSETLLFLDDLERKGVTLKQFIKAVNDSNRRVLPVVDLLNRRYPGNTIFT